MSAAWRCFVAVPLDARLREVLSDAVAAWRRRRDLDALRWNDPDGWHLTLAFMGATDPAVAEALRDRLAAAVAGHPPVELRTGGLGGFPSTTHARVAWYGVEDSGGALSALARSVRAAVGADLDAPFHPHVTLARARRRPVDLRSVAAEDAGPVGRLPVERVELMRSHLGTGPARYATLASVPLGVAARA